MRTEIHPFTDRYLKFTQLYTRTQVEEEPEESIPEKVIRCVWNDQLIATEELQTTDNQWIRFMSHYILGDKERLLKELDSDRKTQGLMQVYQDYCARNQNNCLRCQFPSVVERYFT